MLNFCKDYLRLTLFCCGLLIGIQIPAVVDQYAKRVDAHLIEALEIMSGFQLTADKFFSGDIGALVKHYGSSDDPVFRDDANNIQFIVSRVKILQKESDSLRQSNLSAAFHVLFAHDKKLMSETMQQYSYMLLINPQALIWGIVSGIILAGLLDSLLGCAGYLYTRRRKPAQ